MKQSKMPARTQPMSDQVTVFVRLLDEGVEVWRPVPAIRLGNGRYEIQATDDYDPECETWEFPPGAVVMGDSRTARMNRLLDSN